MTKLNLLFARKISNDKTSMMSLSLKLKLTIALLTALLCVLSLNSLILKPQGTMLGQNNDDQASRFIASAIPKGPVSWEKKAFEVLKQSNERDLASVGQAPSALDHLVFGELEGKYLVRKVEGEIFEIRYFEDGGESPQTIESREKFLSHNLKLISPSAHKVRQIHHEDNAEVIVERYELTDANGKGLGIIQFLLDQDQNLLAMTRL